MQILCVCVFVEKAVGNIYHSVRAVTFGEELRVSWVDIEQDRRETLPELWTSAWLGLLANQVLFLKLH